MDLRSASLEIMQKEFKPFLELAVERHPQPIDIKVKRGNVVTARDYARRIIIKARKEGIGRYTAEQVKALKPRLRVYYVGNGICIAGLKQKYAVPKRWDNYKPPFEIESLEDSRWVTIAVMPSKEEIVTMASMIKRGIFENPIELRTKFTAPEIKKILADSNQQLQIFKVGRNIMLWPEKKL